MPCHAIPITMHAMPTRAMQCDGAVKIDVFPPERLAHRTLTPRARQLTGTRMERANAQFAIRCGG
eukprot:4091900-Lingulodinium_polyedra.AAC.1